MAFALGLRSGGEQEPIRIALVAGLAALFVTQQFLSLVLPTALLFYLIAGALVVLAARSPLSSVLPMSTPFETADGLVLALGLLLGAPLTIYSVRVAVGDINMARSANSIERGDVDAAALAYRNAIAWRPAGSGDDLSYSRQMFHLARISPSPETRRNAMRQAIDAGIRATDTADDRQNAWYSLASMQAAENDPAAVERSLRMSVASAPRWFKPHWALAQLLELQHRHFQAIEEASLAADLDGGKNPEVSGNLAKLLTETVVKP
jgi:hypothetical protein